MDWNQLRQQWQEAAGEPPERDLIGPIAKRDQSLRATIRRRDRLESLVSLLMLPMFGYWTWRAAAAGNWLEAFFAVILVLWAANIPLHLWRTRRALPQPRPEQPAIEYLRQTHAAMLLQARQLERVWIWYLLPCAVGVIGKGFASRGPILSVWIYSAVVLAFLIFLDRLNRRAARTQFRDHAADIERHISLLTEESPQ